MPQAVDAERLSQEIGSLASLITGSCLHERQWNLSARLVEGD